MEIKKTTIKVQCSLNYQVASMEAEIENYTDEELNAYTGYLVERCSDTVKAISNSVGQTHTQGVQKPVVQTQVQRPVQNNTYSAPRTTTYQNQGGFQQRPQYQAKPVSEAQIKYIKGLGYQGQIPQTWDEANILLQQLKAERGIQ